MAIHLEVLNIRQLLLPFKIGDDIVIRIWLQTNERNCKIQAETEGTIIKCEGPSSYEYQNVAKKIDCELQFQFKVEAGSLKRSSVRISAQAENSYQLVAVPIKIENKQEDN